jgi:hypothetical protein
VADPNSVSDQRTCRVVIAELAWLAPDAVLLARAFERRITAAVRQALASKRSASRRGNRHFRSGKEDTAHPYGQQAR